MAAPPLHPSSDSWIHARSSERQTDGGLSADSDAYQTCALDKTLELSTSHLVICRRRNQDAHNQRAGRGISELRGDGKERMS